MQVILEVIGGPGQGRRFDFEEHDVFLVGRSPRCHFCVGPDVDCSRVHAIFQVSPPVCRVRDLGSTNGTFVNGQQITEAVLHEGDEIRAGQTRIAVRVEARDADVRAAARPPEPGETARAPEGRAAEEEGGLEPLRLDDEAAAPAPAAAEPPPLRFADSEAELEEGVGLRFQPLEDEPALPPACGGAGGGAESGASRACARCGRESPAGSSPAPLSGPNRLHVCAECRQEMREQGETIPGYRLLRRFEEGGMGQVWLAEDQRRNRQVAIKTMRPELAASRRMIQMFLRESQISLSLRHPNIVEFLDAGEYHGTLYIVMEYVDGEDAEKLRQREGGRLAENAVVALARQTLEALTHAHGQHIVHRDLKPPNLLVRGRLPSGRVQVTDFGLARNFRAAGMSGLTRRGDVRGSIPFMAPEQVLDCRGVDHRADLYSLGSTMYYLLTGQFIYDFRRGRDPLLTVLEDPVVPLERRGVRVSPPLAGVIHRALCKEVAGRYPSAEAMQQALPTGW